MRRYLIEDEGDEVRLALYQDEEQVGGAVFPDEGAGEAFELAYELAQSWVRNE